MSRGIDATVLTSSKPAGKTVTERIHVLPTLVSYYPVYLATPLLKQIEKIISSERPDIIHLQGPSLISVAVLWSARRRGIPVVAGINDLPRNISVFSPIARGLVERVAAKILVDWLGRMSVTVAPSEYAKSYYRRLGVPTEIRVISSGVDLSTFVPSPRAAQIFSAKYLPNVDPTTPRVLFVGRIMPEKDLEVMIEATRNIDVVPIIVGHAWPSYLQKLKALACGKAIFTGLVPSSLLAGAYSACDAFIQPSTTELQSLVVLEAMASGLPIIGVNSGPIPELVIDGINGFLFEPYNSDDLRRKIELFFEKNGPRRDMRSACLRIVDRHSLARTADEYIKLCTEYAK